ncbi:Laa1 [Kluyveromyces lactis]|nr:Laa1 [Kluyveromyces lactis]
MGYTYVPLTVRLASSEGKRATFINWITESLSCKTLNAADVLDDTVEFLRSVIVAEDRDVVEYESKVISYQLSNLCVLCLKDLYQERPGKVYDFAGFLSNILCENYEEVVQGPALKKRFKKHKSTHLYSVVKDYAITILCHLYACFSEDLHSLSAMIVPVLFKDLKKVLEKPKYFNSNYAIFLMRLFQTISMYSSNDAIDDYYHQKYLKLVKDVFSDISEERVDYPSDFVSSLVENLTGYFESNYFVKAHKNDFLDVMRSNINSILNVCVKYPKWRIAIAESLAKILGYYVSEDLIEAKFVCEFYGNLFCSLNFKAGRIAVLESLHQYIFVNFTRNTTFLMGDKYLSLFQCFVECLCRCGIVVSTEDIELFNLVHNQTLPFLTDSARTSIIDEIFNAADRYFPSDNLEQTQSILGLLSVFFRDLPANVIADKGLGEKIQGSLLKVSAAENLAVRINSVYCLQLFFHSVPYKIPGVVDELLEKLSSQFQIERGFSFAENHGICLLISSIITSRDPDFVSFDLIMRVTAFAVGTLKSNSLSTKKVLYEKELLCWILLTGALCFQDEEYIKTHSPQLFIFWRNIFTHSAVYHSEDELIKNIEIRNHSLSCMISFLRSSALNEELSKQVYYLISKCLNFKHSLSAVSGSMKELLVRYEHRMYQVFLLICPYVHKDVSTSALLQALKNFSNPVNRFEDGCLPVSAAQKPEVVARFPPVDRFSDVLTSSESGDYGVSTFVKSVQSFGTSKPCLLEEAWEKPVVTSRSFDYNHVILNLSPPVPYSIALIDVSLELFSLCFPFTSQSVQRSLIETLISNILTNSHLRHKYSVVKANALFAIYMALVEVDRCKLGLDCTIGELIINVLDECSFSDDDDLYDLKGRCFGFVCAAVKRTGDEKFSKSLINVSIQRIVNDVNPISRGLNLFIICNILNKDPGSSEFSVVLDVIKKFISDPHPVVNVSGLKCLFIVLKKHNICDIRLVGELLELMSVNLFSNNYGPFSTLSFGNNYCQKFNPGIVICFIVSALVEMLGPGVLGFDYSKKSLLKAIVLTLQFSPYDGVQTSSLKICETLSLFKLYELFSLKLSLNVVKSRFLSLLRQNVGCGYLVLFDDRSSASYCSNESFTVSIQYLCELAKLEVYDIYVDSSLSQLCWGALLVFPKSRLLRSYLEGWCKFQVNRSVNVFKVLIRLFDMSFGEYMNLMYSRGRKDHIFMDDKFLCDEEQDIVGGCLQEEGVMESVGSYCRQFIVELISGCVKLLVGSEKALELLPEIPALVKICFFCCSSEAPWLQISSLGLLKCILNVYGEMVDKEDESSYVLEQYSVVLSGAVLPVFMKPSYPKVICEGIVVCAEIVGCGLVPYCSDDRVVNVLVEGLLEIADNKGEIKVGCSTFQLTKRQQEVKHSILRGWGILECKSYQNKNEELEKFVKEYLNVLVPLWIITIRELHSPVWLKIVDSLCAVQSQDPSIINNFDLEGFVFVMFGEILP